MTEPTPDAIRAARESAELTQAAAAALVHVDMRTWRKWELGERAINTAAWELFLLRSHQHPIEFLKTR